MPKKYKALFFDLDNTLWDFEKNSCQAMKQTVKVFGLNFTNSEFDNFFNTYSTINAALWDAYRKNEIGKKELTFKRFQLTFAETGLPEHDFQQMNTVYLDLMTQQTNLVKDVPEVLEYLKNKGYEMYIITNGFKEVQHKKLENTGINGYFKKIFISEVVQSQKPAKEIFEFALKSANAKKSNSIMIGDDWEIDILGAVNYGIDAVYLTSIKSETERIYLTNNKIFYIMDALSIKNLL